MRWTDLVPSEFGRLTRETNLCVVPMGSLERHGEHLPFGCDLVQAETIADMASQIEPCVVFPGWFLAQVHEAECFTGTVNLPQAMAVEALSRVLEGIARNGFKKIVILNIHGGNNHFLDYFSMSQLDEPRDYVLYIVKPYHALNEGEEREMAKIWETAPGGHACEQETSVYMACRPGLTRLDLAGSETVEKLGRFAHLQQNGVENALWWYADYPRNVTGTPSKATEEKGRRALQILVRAAARAIKAVKDDEAAPALQREFMEKLGSKGKF